MANVATLSKDSVTRFFQKLFVANQFPFVHYYCFFGLNYLTLIRYCRLLFRVSELRWFIFDTFNRGTSSNPRKVQQCA